MLDRFGEDELEDILACPWFWSALLSRAVFFLVNLLLKDEKLRSEVLFYQIFAKHSSKKHQHPTSALKRPHLSGHGDAYKQ